MQNWKPEDKQNIWELSGLYEGDIMLTAPEIANKNGLLSDRLRWPDGIVPFYIEEDDFGILSFSYFSSIRTFIELEIFRRIY